MVKSLTAASLCKALIFWKARLRLMDWQIQTSIARCHVLGSGTLGDTTFGPPGKRQAKIQLLDQRDVDGQGFWFDGETWDWELSLVHELLHVHTTDIWPSGRPKPDDPVRIAEERAVDVISKALVGLARQRKR